MERETAIRQAFVALSSAQGQGAVHTQLREQGFSAVEAEEILQAALAQQQAGQDGERRRRQRWVRWVGLVLVACGIGVLVYIYTVSEGGGLMLVPVGLIGYGGYLLATGDHGGSHWGG